MDDSFGLLEEKVRKAADLVKRLRKENKAHEEEVGRARARLQEAEKKLQTLEKEAGSSSEQNREVDGLRKELKVLKQEREDVRGRIGKLVEILEGLE